MAEEAPGEALGKVPAPAPHTNPHSLSAKVQFRFLGWGVPSLSPGRADPVRDVQRDSLCRPGQTLVFYQRVLQGGLLFATKELFLKSVQLNCPTVSWSCVSLESPQPWNRHCMDTGTLSAAKAFGYTASRVIQIQDLCV